MTSLLELREKLKLIYSKNEVFILPIFKFLLAFLALNMVNSQLGEMERLNNVAILLMISLFCSFLPKGAIILFTALVSLLHMYALSLEVAVVGLCLYFIMFLIYFRFSPSTSLVVLLTPILFVWNIPHIIPIAVGLLAGPTGAISVGCGIIVYYFLDNISANAITIRTMEAEETTAKLRMVIDGILNNKAMIVVIVAFSLTVIVVYLLRRMSIDYSWTIAMVAGIIFNLVLLLVGDLLYDTNMSLGGTILGSVLALVIAKVIEFFRFCVDYKRTEKVQFEDDEYYYYVKAIPKMTVAASTKTVKRINAQRKPMSSVTRGAGNSSRNEVSNQYDQYEDIDEEEDEEYEEFD